MPGGEPGKGMVRARRRGGGGSPTGVAGDPSKLWGARGRYHGQGFGALALSSRDLDPRLGRQMPDVHHLTPYRDKATGGADRILANIVQVLRSHSDIACLTAEPMRSNCVLPPFGTWADLFALCACNGVKLIFDEIPSGFGQNRSLFRPWAFCRDTGCCRTQEGAWRRRATDRCGPGRPKPRCRTDLALGEYTHEKNPVTARAALTTVEIIEEEGLVGQAERLGLAVEAHIHRRMQAGQTMITGIRGLGLLRAVTDRPSKALCNDALVTAGLERSASFTTKGRDTVRFSPPPVMSNTELALALGSVCVAIDSFAEV